MRFDDHRILCSTRNGSRGWRRCIVWPIRSVWAIMACSSTSILDIRVLLWCFYTMAPELYKHWRTHFDLSDDVNLQYFLGDPGYMGAKMFIIRHSGLNKHLLIWMITPSRHSTRSTRATLYMWSGKLEGASENMHDWCRGLMQQAQTYSH